MLNPYITTLASGTRADAATEAYDFHTHGREGIVVVLNVTAVGDLGDTASVSLFGRDEASDTYWPISGPATLDGVGRLVLMAHPALWDAQPERANCVVPETVRVEVAHSGAESVTRTLSAEAV